MKEINYVDGMYGDTGYMEDDQDTAIKLTLDDHSSRGIVFCSCCGRHVSELRPIGKLFSPGGFNGSYFVMIWRQDDFDDEGEEAIEEAKTRFSEDGNSLNSFQISSLVQLKKQSRHTQTTTAAPSEAGSLLRYDKLRGMRSLEHFHAGRITLILASINSL